MFIVIPNIRMIVFLNVFGGYKENWIIQRNHWRAVWHWTRFELQMKIKIPTQLLNCHCVGDIILLVLIITNLVGFNLSCNLIAIFKKLIFIKENFKSICHSAVVVHSDDMNDQDLLPGHVTDVYNGLEVPFRLLGAASFEIEN